MVYLCQLQDIYPLKYLFPWISVGERVFFVSVYKHTCTASVYVLNCGSIILGADEHQQLRTFTDIPHPTVSPTAV